MPIEVSVVPKYRQAVRKGLLLSNQSERDRKRRYFIFK